MGLGYNCDSGNCVAIQFTCKNLFLKVLYLREKTLMCFICYQTSLLSYFCFISGGIYNKERRIQSTSEQQNIS